MRNKILVHLLLAETKQPSKQRTGARMPCCWPSGLSALHQTSSDKKDSWLKQMLLRAWCLLQVTSVFFHITVCCRQVECSLGFDIAVLHMMKSTLQWAYWGTATLSTAKELSLFPNNWCSACASSFQCYPSVLHIHHAARSSCHPNPCVVALSLGLLPLGAAHKVYEYLCSAGTEMFA